MHVTPLVWIVTLAVALTFLAIDVFVIGRRPHEPSMRESATHLALFISAAVAFGIGVFAISGSRYSTEFFAGWLTEYSLSVDNLFVFLIIMTKLAVPRKLQQSALLVGIVLALVLRGAFIAVGAAAINNISWIFYLFGGFLVYTAGKLASEGVKKSPEDASDLESEAEEGYEDGRLIRWIRRSVPSTDDYHGSRVSIKENGKRLITPMAVVIVALGTTDLLFALDSIPAIYGLTKEPYLVLTANIFALMGLRQLYFLLGGLLQRLIYLNIGLSILLVFIGVKLILHALHENELSFLNGGEHFSWAPDIPIWLSLVVIIGVLAVTTVASLAKSSAAARR